MSIRNWDMLTSSFWLLLSIGICAESYSLGLGSYHNPGAGFLPFLTGAVLAILSLLLLILARRSRKGVSGEIPFEKVRWATVGLVLAAMLIYAVVLEVLGFLIATLLFLTFVLRTVAQKEFYLVGLVAVVTALATYAVFQLWLKSQLPKGIFGI
jgi:putative tricarboxylic transport membrane protein